MRWHHYAGLGVRALHLHLGVERLPVDGSLGLVRAGPSRPRARGRDRRRHSPSLDGLTLERLRAATTAIGAAAAAPMAELELVLVPVRALLVEPRPLRRCRWSAGAVRIVPALHPERGAFARFDDAEMLAAARAAMPDAPLVDAVWLTQYDAYYYDLHGPAPLPVLRARFGDPQKTWLYLDPSSGTIVRREHTSSRINRWIYHGLHSFDFPFLRARPALRERVVVVLSLGGILVVATSLRDGWRRLARQIRQLGRSLRRLR